MLLKTESEFPKDDCEFQPRGMVINLKIWVYWRGSNPVWTLNEPVENTTTVLVPDIGDGPNVNRILTVLYPVPEW